MEIFYLLSQNAPERVKRFEDYKNDSGKYMNWRGHAFEILCMDHIEQINKALGISGIRTDEYSWQIGKKKDGVQIDLVIDRDDGIINICS